MAQLRAMSVLPELSTFRLTTTHACPELSRSQSRRASPKAGPSGVYSPKNTTRFSSLTVRSALAADGYTRPTGIPSVNTFVIPRILARASEAASKQPDTNARLEEWVARLGVLAGTANAESKKTCCYCGENSSEASQCNLTCACDWHLAHDVWMNNLTNIADLEKHEENMVYVEQLYSKALVAEPDNVLMLADFAVFLWKQKGDLGQVETTLNRALSNKTAASEDRSLILSLYSFFLSSTPPVSSSAHLSDYRQKMSLV